jgi:hypothetical protein
MIRKAVGGWKGRAALVMLMSAFLGCSVGSGAGNGGPPTVASDAPDAPGTIVARGGPGLEGGRGGSVDIMAATGRAVVRSTLLTPPAPVTPAHSAGSLILAAGDTQRVSGTLTVDSIDIAQGGRLEVEGTTTVNCLGDARIAGTVAGIVDKYHNGPRLEIHLVAAPAPGDCEISGTVDLRGATVDGQSPGAGGTFWVVSDAGQGGAISFTGTIDVRGADACDCALESARGGEVALVAAQDLFVQGTIRASGGSAQHGPGGNGGVVALRASGGVTIGGSLLIAAPGGRGVTGPGGAGGTLTVESGSSAGDIDLRGARFAASGGPGVGGGAGGTLRLDLCPAQSLAGNLGAALQAIGAPAGTVAVRLSAAAQSASGIDSSSALAARIAGDGGGANPPAALEACP